jgi:hypothetical protein
VTGSAFVGWILATVAFAGLVGAVKNETWLSVLRRGVNPNATPTVLDPSNTGQGSAVPGGTVKSGSGKKARSSTTDPHAPGGQTGPGF